MASTSPFGEHLKRERELRGVSLEEVSAATRISTKFLVAIEHGQWEHLPGGAFNRGFIRSASKYLGLDEENMVAEYSLETNGNGNGVAHVAPIRPRNQLPRDWRPMAALGAVVLVVVAALLTGGWFAVSKIKARRQAASVTGEASTAVTANATGGAPATTVAASPLALSVKAIKPGSLRVIADGKVLFEGQITAGESKEFGARDTFEIASSDAGSVQLELNGQPVPTMGTPGRPGRVTLTAKDVKSSAGGVH